ncbi:MAG: rhodanese-like domain-containing protein [Geothrix sp.]|nr:rhodanese-like domain-containing protein [Geothrix sp.]
MHTRRSTTLRVLALAGMAGAAALLSNILASPARRLAWAGSGAPLPSGAPQTETRVPPGPPPQPPPLQPPKEAPPHRPALHSVPRAATPPPPAPPKAQEATAFSPIREISGQEAWAAFQSGVSFLDARRSSEFAEGHIAGAWCAPIWESDVDDRLISFKAARRPGSEDPIVIYCSGGDCRDSHLLASKLLNEGYFNLLIYRDGFPDWAAQGHPVEKGQP